MSGVSMHYDRLAVRLALIIGRLLRGEGLSINALASEFNVSPRTLRRDFNQRLIYLDLEQVEGIYRLAKSPVGSRTDGDIIHFAKVTHMAQFFPALDSKLLSVLLNKNVGSPYVVYHAPPKNPPALFGGFYRITQAIIDNVFIELNVQGNEYPNLAPYRLVYFDGYWYLVGEHNLTLQVFLLIHITDVTLTPRRFTKKEYITALTAEADFIKALPHFQFVRNLVFNLKDK
ncbi:WYL domain-containing protein [Yersinia enterocolitica]|uniref:helix-turn-helix transcriptional regulator n=1 Tax=Yersinia TaxID=629 RepID=UPI0011A49653|nr:MULTISPECIES: WYL domain-containing protein [Yersinia]EKN3947806.1 WYL domain-containing protein [Yersinia enterocolitica]EKN6316300.1 WYL domain-containing protein [Yersinia enterocolitica]MCB5302966.1 WYL domain-containing protein [Yersinia bercovieri]UYJ96923.1 WYL domain-containing protein [Yersinia enterocolitica]